MSRAVAKTLLPAARPTSTIPATARTVVTNQTCPPFILLSQTSPNRTFLERLAEPRSTGYPEGGHFGVALRCAFFSAPQRLCRPRSSLVCIFLTLLGENRRGSRPDIEGIREAHGTPATLRILKWQMKTRRGALKNAHLVATQPPGYLLSATGQASPRPHPDPERGDGSRHEIIVVPVTRTIRGLSTEVVLSRVAHTSSCMYATRSRGCSAPAVHRQ